MKKPHKPRPMHVLRAVVERDVLNLQILGQRGNESQRLRKKIIDPKIYPIPQKNPEEITRELSKLWEKKKSREKWFLLVGSWQMTRQANEHICPVD